MNTDTAKQVVLTAGGAALPPPVAPQRPSGKKKRKKKNKNKNPESQPEEPPLEAVQLDPENPAPTEPAPPQRPPSPPQEPDEFTLEMEVALSPLPNHEIEPLQPPSPTKKDMPPPPPVYSKTADETQEHSTTATKQEILWLFFCFSGIMASFVCYGLLLEFSTSGGRKLHELSFLFVTSLLYTLTAATGRYVRDETPSTIPRTRFAILGITSMGSTYCSVASLKHVIYPIQVLAKSCKPVPVMLMGAIMGKKYPLKKYINVFLIVSGVALFMGGGDAKHKSAGAATDENANAILGILLLFVSLCFDGGTGAYEDKLMSVHSVQPFDLMYNIQMGKTILAGLGLLIFPNQLTQFFKMIHEMGFLLIALGLSGAMGQVFIFVTIAKFGALTCSIIGLARKVTTLVASIYFYGHVLNGIQATGLFISVTAMVLNFWGKKGKQPKHHHHAPPKEGSSTDELEAFVQDLELQSKEPAEK